LPRIDYSKENVLFGTHNENQALVSWEYENGVHGLGASDSVDIGSRGPTGAISCHNRLVGTRGVIEVGPTTGESGVNGDKLPPLRIRRAGDEAWTAVDTDDDLHSWKLVDRVIADTVHWLETGDEPELRARNALNATELIFATWASPRRRGRVDLPLAIDDNPLKMMVDTGELTPEPAADDADVEGT
jgi:UDP-N-acetylglucosamine 3-dehydrogenase